MFGGPGIMGPAGTSTYNQYFQRAYALGPNNYNVLGVQFALYIISPYVYSSSNINEFVGFSLNGATFTPSNSEWSYSSCPTNSYISNGPSVTYSANQYIGYVKLFRPFSGTTATFTFTMKRAEPSTQTSFGLTSMNPFSVTHTKKKNL